MSAITASPSIRLGSRFANALNDCFLINLIDDAVADIFCLQTYTHGTSPKSYNSIMKTGADPAFGGNGGESGLYKAIGHERHETAKQMGEKSGWNTKGRFFIFLHDCPALIKRWQPRVYSIVACYGENASYQQNKLAKILLMIASFIEAQFVPNLKFRLQPNSQIHVYHDETFGEKSRIAGYTEQVISPDHIGIYGSFSQGLNKNWGQRIQNNPKQFTLGLLKLVITVACMVGIVFAIQEYPLASMILLVYGAVTGLCILGRLFVPLLSFSYPKISKIPSENVIN